MPEATTFMKFDFTLLARALGESRVPRQQRLARARRPVEQHALRRLDADSLEELGVGDRQLDGLAQQADLVVEAADLFVGDVARVFGEHLVHHGVDFFLEDLLSRGYSDDRQRGQVQRDSGADLELALVQFGHVADDVALAVRRLDHDCGENGEKANRRSQSLHLSFSSSSLDF